MIALSGLTLAAAAPPHAAERAWERELMVMEVANMAATAGVREVSSIDPEILAAMRSVPRHLLVPQQAQALAYRNVALPIGHEATISQPYIVALMTHLLDTRPKQRILEVGTGSGYQAAILSALGARIHTIEIVEPLALQARERLAKLGYGDIQVRAGDGYAGWPEAAPFDRIIVTAGADHVPKPLIEQLKPGGIMVIPLGPSDRERQLVVVRKNAKGQLSRRSVLPVRFVPLVRGPNLNRR